MTLSPLKFSPMSLALYNDPGDGGDMICHRFTHEIGWLRQCLPRIEARHGDAVIKTLSLVLDEPYLLCTIDLAVKAAEGHCEAFKVDMNSTLHIDVIADILDVPVIRGTSGIQPPPEGWLIYDEAKLREMDAYNAAIGGDGDLPPVPVGMDGLASTRNIQATQCIWSSNMAPSINALVVHKFKERWLPADVFSLDEVRA